MLCNLQYKDAYIPCFDFETIADDQLLRQGLVLSTAEDKAMLDPKLGVEKAIKEDQN